MLPIFSAAWTKKPEERAKHADTAERLNETHSLFLKKRSQSFICLPDEVLGPSLFWRFDTTITQKKICISVLFSKQTNWNLQREARASYNIVIPNQCAHWCGNLHRNPSSPSSYRPFFCTIFHNLLTKSGASNRGIATPVCALARNDRKFGFGMTCPDGPTNSNFPNCCVNSR